jgi:hypothetical protein
MSMDRRNFLRILPISAIAPKVVKDGVVSLEVPKGGHFVIVFDSKKVNMESLAADPAGLLPEGASGYLIPVYGNPEEAIKFYKLDETAQSED